MSFYPIALSTILCFSQTKLKKEPLCGNRNCEMDRIVYLAFNMSDHLMHSKNSRVRKWTNLTHKRRVKGWLYNYQSTIVMYKGLDHGPVTMNPSLHRMSKGPIGQHIHYATRSNGQLALEQRPSLFWLRLWRPLIVRDPGALTQWPGP